MSSPSHPLRIAHLSDTHLGYRALYRADPESGRNQRAIDIEGAFEAAISDLLTRDVDLVIHAGDVFHHTRPSWQALRTFIRQTRRLEHARLPCIIIAGNHDTPRLRTSGSAFSVLELALPEVNFVTRYQEEVVTLPELNLCLVAVPHGALTNPDPILALPQSGMRNVLVTHGMMPGMKMKGQREAGEEELSPGLLDPEFDYVALGHYHIWGEQGANAWYAGSTERTGWGDEEATPGYLIVELGAPGDRPRVEHVPLPARPMKTLRPVSGDGRNARELADIVLDRLKALDTPEAMTRIEFRDTSRPVRREAESILRRESPEFVWALQVFSPADILANFERTPGTSIGDVRAHFHEFVAERTGQVYDQAFAEAFLARGDRALAEAIQAAEAVVSSEDSTA